MVGAAGQHRARAARRGRCPSRCPRRRGRGRRCRGRRRASSSSSRSRPRSQRWSSATRVAAASAEPPAIPPATGMPLRMATWTGSPVVAAPRGAGRPAGRGCRSPGGTPPASGPDTLTPHVVGDGDGDVVVEAHRLVDGGEGVVAVLARRPDEELEVDLGRDAHGDRAGHERGRGHGLTLVRRAVARPTRAAAPIRAKAVDVELLPAGPRVDPRGDERLPPRRPRAGPPGEGGPQRLAALGEGRVDDARRPPRAAAVVGGGSRRVSATRPESTLGTGQKTLRGTLAGQPDLARTRRP